MMIDSVLVGNLCGDSVRVYRKYVLVGILCRDSVVMNAFYFGRGDLWSYLSVLNDIILLGR